MKIKGIKRIDDFFLKNKRIDIRVSEDLYKDLKKLAKSYNMTVSSLVRYMILSSVQNGKERELIT